MQGTKMLYGLLPTDEIELRWTLRDIHAGRLKISPIPLEELQRLIDLGLVEMMDDIPQLTDAGLAKIER